MESVPMSDRTTDLHTTPLNALHIELGARMVPFAGYSMPVQYPAGLMAEHQHTRTAAGLFDVSHMGQLRLVGPDAAAAFETLMPVDVDRSAGRQAALRPAADRWRHHHRRPDVRQPGG
jgi:aminomethyltransferase